LLNFPNNNNEIRCQNALGPERLMCNPDQTSGLYEILNAEEICLTNTNEFNLGTSDSFRVHGQNYGIGAIVRCSDYEIEFVKRGFGYYSHEKITFYSMDNVPIAFLNNQGPFYALTKKVLIQPYNNTSFNIDARGVEIINLTKYTSIFGKAVEEEIFVYDANYTTMYIGLNVLLGIFNVICIVLHITLIFAGSSIQRDITDDIIAKRGIKALRGSKGASEVKILKDAEIDRKIDEDIEKIGIET